MKMKHLALAVSIALVPATVALADDAKKEAIKKAKEEAKQKALDEARAKAEAEAKAKAAELKKDNAVKQVEKKEAKKEADDAAKKAEDEQHAKNLGVIERLEQVATTFNMADLKTKVEALKTKEDKRHTLATGG